MKFEFFTQEQDKKIMENQMRTRDVELYATENRTENDAMKDQFEFAVTNMKQLYEQT